jgi:Asp-tRNA(Asn)/Glu-tRNA(Gln) amidotransferase A subunit family amidase
MDQKTIPTAPRALYDLESLSLPRLQGASLALVTAILEHAATRPLLVGRFLRDGGISRMRRLAFEEAPTFTPLGAFEAFPAPRTGPPSPPLGPELDALPAREVRGHAAATVADYARAYRSGATTPEQVAARALAALEAADRADPPLRAFVAWSREEILASARTSAARFADGKPLGILDGVPVAVKDEVDQAGYPTTVGTRFLGARGPAVEDATVVARLRAAGALLLGKTNMHEIGIGVTGLNPNPAHGCARNPHDPGRHTGGSSSGSAAAVAAGLCPLAVGADGGGSIRIPAALCGVVGLKPTFGRVSERGAFPLTWSLGHLGPIAASVADAAIGYAVMAGPDPLDPNTAHQPPVTLDGLDAGVAGLTLGVFRPWAEHAAPVVVERFTRLLGELERAGARVREVDLPELEAARVAHVVTITSEMATSLDLDYAAHRRDYSLEVRLNLALARTFTSRDYVIAQRVRTRSLAHARRALESCDAIVSPTTAIPAPAIAASALERGESDITTLAELMRFAFHANLTGLPAVSFPAGHDEGGLPIGMQAMGRPHEEHLLLRIAYAAEGLVERRRPRVAFDLLGG